jgi:acid phosphatase family membrane protein YuiD
MVGKVSDIRYFCWQVMYDATGVRLQAGRQAEV